MDRRENAGTDHRKQSHRFGRTVNRCSPLLPAEVKNRGDQRAGVTNTKFVMSHAHPTGILFPQTPTPVKTRYRIQKTPNAAKKPAIPIATPHQKGAFLNGMPVRRSVIQDIERLFSTISGLGIRSTKGITKT